MEIGRGGEVGGGCGDDKRAEVGVAFNFVDDPLRLRFDVDAAIAAASSAALSAPSQYDLIVKHSYLYFLGCRFGHARLSIVASATLFLRLI